MQKLKIKEVHIKTPEAEIRLEYYFILKGGMCGIKIRDACNGASATRFVPGTPEEVCRLARKLARHTVQPAHLGNVVDDYIYENWLR